MTTMTTTTSITSGRPPLPRAWLALICVRFLLAFAVQPGYIHPNEFFQGTEVLAGHLPIQLLVERSHRLGVSF